MNDNNTEDEAMEAASNVMETTTNDSSSASSNSTTMDPVDEAEEVTMEDAASADDIAMDQVDNVEEDDDVMVAVTANAASGVPPSEQQVEFDETMEDKNLPVDDEGNIEIVMKTTQNNKDDDQEVMTAADAEIREMDSPPAAKIMSTRARLTLTLHDCLALGEIESGLGRPQKVLGGKENEHEQNSIECHQRAVLEIQRLPYTLRLLSNTRPSASITTSKNAKTMHAEQNELLRDNLVDTVVQRLEDVAATYSVAEGVDVMTNYLARSATKQISKLKPLSKRITTSDGEKIVEWDTTMLAELSRDPLSGASLKRKREAAVDVDDTSAPTQESLISPDSDVDLLEVEEESASVPLKKRKSTHRRHSMEMAAEDSQEATFVKTLSELVSLVVKSLDHKGANDKPQDADDDQAGEEEGRTLFSLKMDDSILSETGRGADEETGGAMEGSDLGSTVADIMHYAPVLRSNHVASAFCRASLPRTGDLLTRVGANCPATVPSLLSGCIETYISAVGYGNRSIISTTKQGVTALAKLSRVDCAHVFNKLQSLNVMLDVQLKLTMDLGLDTVSCLISRHLSILLDKRPASKDHLTTSILQASSKTQTSHQSSVGLEGKENEELGPRPFPDCGEQSLVDHLIRDRSLLEETLTFFSKQISSQGRDGSNGKWCLGLRSLAMILLVPFICTEDNARLKLAFSTLSKSFESFFVFVSPLILPEVGKPLPKTAKSDKLFGVLTSCIILLSARMLSCESPGDAMAEDRQYIENICQLQQLAKTSECMHQLWSSIGCAFKVRSADDLFHAATGQLVSQIEGARISQRFFSLFLGLEKLVVLSLPLNYDSEDDTIVKTSAVARVAGRHKIDTPEQAGEMERILERFLLDGEGRNIPASTLSVDMLRFVRESTKLLAANQPSKIPIVSSSTLEISWSRVVTSEGSTTEEKLADNYKGIYLLRLFYSLEFMDANPTSMFAVDPRSLPLREAVGILQRFVPDPACCFFLEELHRLLQKHCPDVLLEMHYVMSDSRINVGCDEQRRDEQLESLYNRIRSVVNTKPEDPAGVLSLELQFLKARSRISDAGLYSTVVSALLSSPNIPAPRFSYGLICRDPVVVFRCPLYLWSYEAVRRILLTSLRTVMMANEVIALRECKGEHVAEELLVSRDAIIVRCLVAVLHGGISDGSSSCSLTECFLRWLVSRRNGLLSLLVKQGISERDLDWIVERVPELMTDRNSLLQVLGANSLTAAERLVAADAISRIAVVYGGDSNDHEASQMASVAVSELVESFSLIVGPVGVPVNALLNDDLGTDITQTSRQAAFRILKSLIRVRARRQSFQGCDIFLQKLATLCKGESASGGLQGVTASRRKQFLKELYDAASKPVGISCSGTI